jgi:hypothetical protein
MHYVYRMKRITKNCANCDKPVTRVPSQMKGNVCCGLECTRQHLSKRMAKMNIELNPERMILETRQKLRDSRLNTGEGKTYTKTFSKHTHRIVAEEKLGRPLKKGEIVHHIDENKRNNDPDNIEIFPSQAEHARHHMLKKLNRL